MMRNYNKYKNYKTKRKSFNPYIILAVFIVIIIFMSVGYGAYSDIIRIIGTANANYTTCTINYVLNGGTNVANPVTSFRLLVDDIPLPIPTKINSNFSGWFLNSSFTGSSISSTIEINPEDITNNQLSLYAKWTGTSNNTITYELYGGTQAVNQVTTYIDGQSLTILEPTRSGYVFDGWYDNSSFTGNPITSTAVLTGDVTLHAKWIEQYTITYELNGGTQAANQVTTFIAGQSLTILDATYTGCDFDGWYDNSSFTGNAITTTSGLAANITLYAKYKKNVEFLIDTTLNTITLTSNQISSSNTASFDNFIAMTFEGFNSTNRVINRIDVNLTYTSSGGQTKRITCNLNAGGTTKTGTFSFVKNGTTTSVSFTGLNIGQNDTFTITNAEDFAHNRSLTIRQMTITVYFNN